MVSEYKSCPFCAEEIKASALKCKHCGEYLDEDLYQKHLSDQKYANSEPEKIWSPGIAGVMSLVIPGAGQLYKGQVGSGIFWLLLISFGYFISFSLTIMLITAIIAPFTLIITVILHGVCIYNAVKRPM